MKPTSHSVARLMSVVAVVAGNLAVARDLFGRCPPLMLGVGLSGPALQIAGLCLLWGRGRSRPFCVGFLAAGLLALASFVGAMLTGPNLGLARDPATGKVRKITVPGSPLWTAWSSYSEAAGRLLGERLPVELPSPYVLPVLIMATPQILAAVVGGLLARGIVGRSGRGPTGARGGPRERSARAPSSPLVPVEA